MEIKDITPDMVLKVYSGKQGCMCGCLGKYWANPNHLAEANAERGYDYEPEEVSLKHVKRVLKILQEDPRAELDREILHIKSELVVPHERNFVVYLRT